MIPSGAELDDLFLLLRTIERGILFLVIVSVTVAFMIMFRRALQNIAVRLKTEEVTFSTSLSLSMPIFLLLVLVGFSWVVYSSPVSVERPDGSSSAGAIGQPNQDSTSQSPVRDDDIEQIAVILKTLRDRRSQVTETNLSTAISRAMLVLEDQLRTLVDTKFGDGSFAFYESTSVQLGPTSASGDLANLGLTTDQADKYYAIEELLSVDALGAQP